MVKTYFFDTYALIGSIKGGESYAEYAKCECKTSLLNLIELYYIILRDFGKQEAAQHFKRLKQNLLEIDDEEIQKAMEFRLSNKKKNLSYADCIGYTVAENRGIKFLTGDEQFRSMPNVEFVK